MPPPHSPARPLCGAGPSRSPHGGAHRRRPGRRGGHPPTRAAPPAAAAVDPPIAVIACDVDGTLLTSDHALTPRVAAALMAAEAAGVPVLLATGKAPPPAAPWWAPVVAGLGGAPRPGVFLQGALLLDAGGRELYCASLHPDAVAVAAAVAAAVGATLAVYASDAATGRHRVLASARDARTDRIDGYGEPRCEAVGDVAAAVAAPGARAHKAIFLHEDQAVLDDAHGAVAQLLGAQNASITSALAGMVEVLPPGVDKADGVLRMLGEMGGVDPAALLALGDGDNDAGLLAMAGVGAAVGNAGAAARAAASVVLAETNDADAVAVGVERYVLAPRGWQAPPVTPVA